MKNSTFFSSMKTKSNCNPFPNCELPECSGILKTVSLFDPKGKKSNYRLVNSAENYMAVCRVEDCLIKDGDRCDYLLFDCEAEKAYFIELKGSNLSKAVGQIDNTLTNLINQIYPKFKISARIVLTRVNTHALTDTAYKRLEKRVKNLGGTLKKSSNAFMEESNKN